MGLILASAMRHSVGCPATGMEGGTIDLWSGLPPPSGPPLNVESALKPMGAHAALTIKASAVSRPVNLAILYCIKEMIERRVNEIVTERLKRPAKPAKPKEDE